MDLENNLDTQSIKKRSVAAVLALISRTFLVQIISFVATLVLTYYLDPAIYGVFYLVSSVINFFGYFSDVGLAAALIQKKEKLTKEDLATTFTIQQLLVLSGAGVLLLFSNSIKNYYNLPADGLMLFYGMLFAFLLSSLKTIPSILLEREIQFQKLIMPQVLETLVFNIVAVYFAIKGFGVNSFTYAVVARGIVGLVAIYFVSPWKPIVGIYRGSIKSLLKFGVPYQANTFLAILKDDGMTIFLSKVIGATGVGYIGWASKWAGLPLRIIMDNLTKVSFPVFARLQSEPERLAKAVSLNLKFLSLITFPALILMGFLATPLATMIPRYQKWLPAIVPLYFYLYNSAWASLSTSLTNLLNATGNIKTTFKLMIMWTSLTWLSFPLLSFKFGYLGVAYATGLVATSSIATIYFAQKIINFEFLNSIKSSLLSSTVMGLFLYFSSFYTSSIASVVILGAISVTIYLVAVFVLEGKQLLSTAKQFTTIKNV